MKKIIISVLALTIFLFAEVGQITALKGEAIVLRDGQKLIASLGFKLKQKDKIQTSSSSRLQIVFIDNTIVSLGKKSRFDITSYINDTHRKNVKFTFGKGVFKTITGVIGKLNPKKFKLITKSSNIGIRGTIVGIVSTSSADTITVPEGKIVITTGITSIEVNAGEMTTVVQGQIPVVQKIPVEIQKKIETESGAKENEEESGQGEKTKTTQKKLSPSPTTSQSSDEQRVQEEQKVIDADNDMVSQENIDNAKKDALKVAEEIAQITKETEENNLKEQEEFIEQRRLEALRLYEDNLEYLKYKFGNDITEMSVTKSAPSTSINLEGFSQGGNALSLDLTSSSTSLDITNESLISNFSGNYTTAKYINKDQFAIVTNDFWFATVNNDINDEFDISWGFWGDSTNIPNVWVAGIKLAPQVDWDTFKNILIGNIETATPFYSGHLIGSVTTNGKKYEILSENSTFQMQMDLGKSINDRVTGINVIASYGDSSQSISFSDWNITGQGHIDENGNISFDNQNIDSGILNLKGAFYNNGNQIGGTLDYKKGVNEIDAGFRANK